VARHRKSSQPPPATGTTLPTRQDDGSLQRQPGEILGQTEIQFSSYQGWLLPAPIAAGWEELLPGAANRVMTLMEEQIHHRIAMERATILGNVRAQRWGLIFSALIVSIIVIGGIGLIAAGKEISGLAAIAGAIASVLIVFVTEKRRQDDELREKRQQAGMESRAKRR
jgi:uncharacterized membrane protein